MNCTQSTLNKTKNQENKNEKGNWAAVSNEMLEYFASSDLTAREFKIVMFFLRQLNGWGLKLKAITLQEITHGTKLPTNRVAQTLKSLIQKGIIQKIKINKGRTFHYGFTDDQFYRAFPLEVKKEVYLKEAISAKPVPIISAKPVPIISANIALIKTSEAATITETQISKDSFKDILKTLKRGIGEEKRQAKGIYEDQMSIEEQENRKEFLRQQALFLKNQL